MKTISLARAKGLLRRAKNEGYNQAFSCLFVKRTNGELRRMTCRFGVKKYLAGGKKTYDEVKQNLLGVYDMRAADPERAYRCINLDYLICFKIKGQEYVVEENRNLLTERPYYKDGSKEQMKQEFAFLSVIS